ncbi:MAG: MscL family protein [Bifidobacteriaceae bacterium]|jgi:large conductance mechanosensitive channel|nr:MscL family protein [Bifidobacteriaceae bacterium]
MGKRDKAKAVVKKVGRATKVSTKKVAQKSLSGVRKTERALKGFKEFITHGSSFELAVGVVIGGAVTALVNAIVQGVINPLIALLVNVDDFSDVWKFNMGTVTFSFGLVLSAMINLILVSAVIYFFFILPLNKLHKYVNNDESVPDYPAETVQLLEEIKQEIKKGR